MKHLSYSFMDLSLMVISCLSYIYKYYKLIKIIVKNILKYISYYVLFYELFFNHPDWN